MDTPICLSQYFVNKQNVRSSSNIVKTSFWRHEDKVFYRDIFHDDLLVSELTPNIKYVLTELKSNLKSKCKNDFKNCFPPDNNLKLHSIDKEYIFRNCWKGLSEIIPKKIYGSTPNNKIFKNLIRNVVHSMKRQHFIIENIISKWDMSVLPWKINLNSKHLKNIIVWICEKVLAPMISLNFYVTTCKIDANENKLYYFWKHQWQSFYDRKISNMIFTKAIKKCEPYSLGKNIKRIHASGERLKLRFFQKNVPKLYLILKPNNECRPIVRYKTDTQSTAEKYKVKERLKFLRLLTGKAHGKIEHQYNTLYSEWIKANKPKLFFVKTDLSNAFGSINKEKLMKILSERHMQFQMNEKCLSLKKKVAQQYKDMVAELRKPLLIRVGSTIYEWKEGLVQGYKYSPALSELYYAHLDEIYFSSHLKDLESQIKLFIRVVDDYLYITDSLEDALSFLEALTNYRNVNYEKTVVNFPHERIKFSEEITFLGYSYNTCLMHVSRANTVYKGQMCYKIAFTSALADLNKFLVNRIGQSGIQINTHIFNMHHNNENLIWRHIFTTYCLSANKFCTILAILCNEKEMNAYMTLYKKRVTVKLTNSMLETLARSKPLGMQFMYCINHFRFLSWKALYLCAKGTKKCTGLVPPIRDELAKSNCVYGNWRPHACRIDSNGEIKRAAIKEICRRTDLRQIFKDFEVLPCGFECYDHRKLNM